MSSSTNMLPERLASFGATAWERELQKRDLLSSEKKRRDLVSSFGRSRDLPSSTSVGLSPCSDAMADLFGEKLISILLMKSLAAAPVLPLF